jgi:alcohol dehydrogenase, propanol-preferring
LCEAQLNAGYSVDGGYAEYAAAYARHVVKVPDGVDSLDAAPHRSVAMCPDSLTPAATSWRSTIVSVLASTGAS